MIRYSSFLLAMVLLSSGCGSGGDSSPDDSSIIDMDIGDSIGVVINEVLADNNSTNRDPDLGNYSDWIELKNSTSQVVDISEYGLSDSSKKVKWNFPSGTTIEPNGFLLVWADDFNSTANPNPTALHTSFKIKSNDDKVVLFNKSDEIIDELKLGDYKVTQSDISVARDTQGAFILTNPPTPNAQNNSASFVISSKPDFSLSEGVYSDNPLNIIITAQNGAEIYYTTDGTDATINSPFHGASPITLNFTENKTTLKAIVQESGNDKLISKERSKTFVIAPEHSIVINEIFADNNSSLLDEYKKSDWIELHNSSDVEIDIGGYTLSDSKKIENSIWHFPIGTMISGNSYLVVFADGESRISEPFHSDFKLSDDGDSVVLYNSDDQIIDFKDFGKLKNSSLSRQGDNNFTKTEIQTPSLENTK